MTIYLGLLGVLCFCGIRFDKIRTDYLSVERTNCIKGIFIILVFFSHIVNGYVTFDGTWDVTYMYVRKVLGQSVVSLFLFYSGYGIYLKLCNTGGYCQTIPIRRILPTLIKFDIAVILFAIYGYATGSRYGVKKLLLTFLGWDGIGNSNWYIFCILWLYLFVYLSFGTFKDKKTAMVAMLLLTCCYIGILSKYKGTAHWWYDTALCYVAGMLYARYQKQIESKVDENLNTWIFSVAVTGLLFCVTYLHKDNAVLYQIMILAFMIFVVFITMHIQIKNKVLEWFGNNLFELYILQRLPMMLFKRVGLASYNRYLYVAVCFVITMIMAVIFRNCISNKINFVKRRTE